MSIISKLLTAFALFALCSFAQAEGLQDSVDQARVILKRFKEMPEQSIPEKVLRDARGLAILSVVKAGFVLSARGGQGIVIARTSATNGWSGPSAIATGGAGFGFQIGAQASEFVLVLNTPEAVRAFSRGGNISLGTDLSVAAGPVGRNLAVDVAPMAAIYTYSRSQGLFAGVSLEGTVIITRGEANTDYYGRKVQVDDILKGKIPPPAGSKALIDELKKY
ncbi:MAG: YSC84-related protein [Kiritimatiellia bacterium]